MRKIEFSNEFLNALSNYLSHETEKAVRECYGGLHEGLIELYRTGFDILCGPTISIREFERLTKQIQTDFRLDPVNDYDLVEFLVCFTLGFEREIASVRHRRKQLKVTIGTFLVVTDQLCRRAVSRQSNAVLTEMVLSDELQQAQEARWACDFARCGNLTRNLYQRVRSSNLSQSAARWWTANIDDLKVEAFFTTGDSNYINAALSFADRPIEHWWEIRSYEKFTHALLRKAVLHRQTRFLTGSCMTALFESLGTLQDAENAVASQLISSRTQDSKTTLFSLYLELAKAYAYIKASGEAWQYYKRASRELENIADSYSRRRLDLVRAKAVILSEQAAFRGFYDINRFEIAIEEMLAAIQEAQEKFANDFVLRELLAKDLIPLLATLGNAGKSLYKEEAERLLGECRKRALELGLFHELRGQGDISNRFSVHIN